MFCPFIREDCRTDCALYAGGIKQCSLVAVTMLVEGIHDMGVYAYNKFVREVSPEETAEAENPADYQPAESKEGLA